MNKRHISLFLAVCLTLSPLTGLFSTTVFADAAPSLNVNAKAAVLMEPTSGVILLEQNAHDKLAPASVTKVMTLLLIYEAIDAGKIKWDDIVTTSAHAAGMGGSQVFLEPMEKQNVRDLVKSVVIASGNDAAVALAEFIAGSEEGFVILMNKRAKELGMFDTNFVNACGLDTPGHVTSAYDIALMSRELITKHPQIHEYSTIWMDTITHKTARGEAEFGLTNTNRLIKAYNGATGLKTGSTSGAGFCISATATRDGMNQIAVVLGAPDGQTRFHEAMKMLDYGFANFAAANGLEAGAPIGEIEVLKGVTKTVPISIAAQVTCLVPKGKSAVLEHKIEKLDMLSAPFTSGAKAGEIIYYFEGKEVGRADIVATTGAEKAGLTDMIGRVLEGWYNY